MTIHKSKGLEFPVVVLADASREPRGGSEAIYLSPADSVCPLSWIRPPMIYRLAKWENQKQDEAESLRLLYVALTRAKDKRIIKWTFHANLQRGMACQSLARRLCTAAQVDADTLVQQSGTAMLLQLNSWANGARLRGFSRSGRPASPTKRCEPPPTRKPISPRSILPVGTWPL